MNIVNYSPKFNDVIQSAKNKRLFLGTGNPDAKILFVGKEAAIDKEKHPQYYEAEITNNVNDWEYNCNSSKQFDEVENFMYSGLLKYNPLYPYKGQKNKVQSRFENGEIKSGKGGTSRTWYNYQKIIDYLVYEDNKSLNINFHEHAFISELNQETGSYSKDIPINKRAESIEKRKELFATPFFREFPITIVAVGHYVRDFDINLEDIFKMKFHEAFSKEHSVGLNKEYLNIHFDNMQNPTKLLIHTNQLSMVSNELIRKLGEVCSLFLNKK